MIIVAPTKVEWSSEDSARLKEFLNSQTGSRVLEVLAIQAPELLDGSHPNKALVAAGTLAGYQGAISTIFRLTYENPNPPDPKSEAPTSYQSLDDDAAWVDSDPPLVDKPEKQEPLN
jgi:hypothetical protein